MKHKHTGTLITYGVATVLLVLTGWMLWVVPPQPKVVMSNGDPCGFAEIEFVSLSTTDKFIFTSNGADVEIDSIKLPISGSITFDSCTNTLQQVKIGNSLYSPVVNFTTTP